MRWPNKVGKKAAEKAYQRAIVSALPDTLLAGIDRYIATKPPDRPWCNPATWLNQERWLDEPAPQPERTNGHDKRNPLEYTPPPVQRPRHPAPTADDYAALEKYLAKHGPS